MAITRVPLVDDDGSGTTGSILNNAWQTGLYDAIDALTGPHLGVWTDTPFNAAHYVGTSPMTWTVESGDVLQNRYLVMGKTLFWSVYVFGSTLAGTAAASVRVTLPVGTSKTSRFNALAYLVDGPASIGLVASTPSGAVTVTKSGSNFTLNTNGTHVAFTMILELT